MSLKFIYGRSGSGKTHFCLNDIKSSISSGTAGGRVLLVPEQFTYQAERDLITLLKTGGILNTEVLSFRRLAFRVFNAAGGVTYPHVHPSGKNMILYRILDRIGEDLKVFKKSADKKGFVNTLSTLITEFKRYHVTPDVLEKINRRMDDEHPLKEKLKEIAVLYSLFEQKLGEGYRDPDDDLTIAAEKLRHTSLFDQDEIWIDGFSGFTPQEYLVINSLMPKARRMTISFCTDCLAGEDLAGNDIFISVKSACKKLMQMARENGIRIEPAVAMHHIVLPRFKLSPELAHLETFLHTYPYRIYEGKTQDISFFRASNMFSETEACAADIIRLCREKGYRYRDIAVVTGHLSGYEKFIDVLFTEYEIPFFIDRKVDITNHPLVRLILSMLSIFSENWTYESVFRYLKTGLTGVAQEDIDVLENYVLSCGIRGSDWMKEEAWRRVPQLIPDAGTMERFMKLLETVNRIRRQVTAPLLEFREKTRGRRKASWFCENLYHFLCALGVPERIQEEIDIFSESGDLIHAAEYSKVWNIVMEVFDQIAQVMGEDVFGTERFLEILRIGFDEYQIGLIPASLDQVLVGSVERSRSHEVKAMFILGANDGFLPPVSFEEGVLSDKDRHALNQLGIELAGDTTQQVFDGQYLLYRALTTAGQYLRISWPIADNEGKALRPSMVVYRLGKLFPAISVSSDIVHSNAISEEMDRVSHQTSAYRAMIFAFRQQADGQKIARVWPEVYRWFLSQKSWRGKCLKVREAFIYRNRAEAVSKDRVEALYGDPVISSVSRVETYAMCPFAYFVKYGLNAQERKIFSLSPPDVGTFMHLVIEKFSEVVSTGNITWRTMEREWCEGTISNIVEEMLLNMEKTGAASSRRYQVLLARLKRVTGRAVWLISQHIKNSSFEPVDYEAGFGRQEKYPPITLEFDSGKRVLLTGRIDRVDALETAEGKYLRIIDYKSGNREFKLSDVYDGLQLQLVTYLDAIYQTDETDRSPNFPGGVLYFKIDDPMIKGDGRMTAEEAEIAVMKQLKMRGLLLADVKLIREMDHSIDGNSLFIPAAINKGDVIGKNSSVATSEQFSLLRRYVRELLSSLCNEMINGKVSISPYKKKNAVSCRYCSFSSVCQFDTATENTYRTLYEKDNEAVWGLMEKKENRKDEFIHG